MARTHPTVEILTEYASGSLTEGLSLLVAAHLTFCPACRADVSRLEAIGGAMMEHEASGPTRGPSLDAVLSRIDLPEGPVPALPAPAPGLEMLPHPVRARLADGQPAWRFRMPGLSECPLDGFDGESVSLLRARPGASMFAHTHRGEEATLILSGALRDADRVFERGDVALADQLDDHRPEIVGNETCICLVVMSGSLRFTGPFSRVLNVFTR